MARRACLLLMMWSVNVEIACTAASAADEVKDAKKSGEIKIALKDFKFKVPPEKPELFAFDEDGDRLCFYSVGAAEAKFNVENDGEFDVVLSLSGDSAMNIHPKFKLTVDEKEVGKETSLKSDDIKDYKLNVALKGGKHVLSIAFTNDIYDAEKGYDSNLYLHAAKIAPHVGEVEKKEAEKK